MFIIFVYDVNENPMMDSSLWRARMLAVPCVGDRVFDKSDTMWEVVERRWEGDCGIGSQECHLIVRKVG